MPWRVGYRQSGSCLEFEAVSATAAAQVKISNKLGLHARPAMMFVEVANGFDSTVTVARANGGERLDGKSIMQMMMLAATCGTEIEITADGPDAEEAVAKLVDLVESKFDED